MSYIRPLLVLVTLQNCERNDYGQIPKPMPYFAEEPCISSSPQNKLRIFLDYLAEVCHSRKCGRVVTAIAVRDRGDKPAYVVASPGRVGRVKEYPKDRDLKRSHLEEFLIDLLAMFSDPKSLLTELEDIKSKALSHVVEFNRRRLRSYVLSLSDYKRSLQDENWNFSDEKVKANGTQICLD